MAANTLNFGSKVAFISGIPVTLPIAASDPGTSVLGDMYFNSTLDTVRVYNGTLWTSVGSTSYNKETFILSSLNISNGYVDLAFAAKSNSTIFLVQGGPVALEGASYDYSVSIVGGVTRITFLNSLTSGPGALVSGNVIQIAYSN